MKEQIRKICTQINDGQIAVSQATEQLLDLFSVSVSLPHESEIETVLDKLMIIRGEHPTRVRNPIYGEERQLAKDLVKYVLLSNER